MKWEKLKLKDISLFIKRGISPTYTIGIGYKVVNQKCIRDNFLNFELSRLSSEDKKVPIERFIFKGDCLVNSTGAGTLGRTAFVKTVEPYSTTVDSHVTIIRPNPEKVFDRFLGFHLAYREPEIESKGKGATNQTELSPGDLGELEIPLPPLPTQQKIASILSAYDDLIENNLKRIRLLEEAAQHLYREWFVRFRFPGWEEVEVVDGLPVGWERKALGKICTEISSGGTPDRGNPLYWASPEIQWVKTKELRDDFVFECEERISKEGLENSSAKIFPEGTILMAIYASPTLGRLGILTNEACFNQAMVGFKIDRNQTSTEFLYYKLLEERLPLNNMAIGAAQQNINVKKVKEYEVILPSLDLINTFSRITSPFFSQRRALGGQNQKLKEARDILLPRLMNQTIVV